MNEENKIDSEYEELDNRYFPCENHQEPDCEICFYPKDTITNAQPSPIGENAEFVANSSILSSTSETTSNVSMNSE